MASAQVYIYFDENGKISFSNTNPHKATREFKGRSLLELPDDYVVIDLETTGLSPDYDEIIEIAALRYRNDSLAGSFSTLVKPQHEIPEFITELTGITNDMVSNAPNIKKALINLNSFLSKDDIILGYNVNFDINFLYDNYESELNEHFTNNFVDVMRIARRIEKTLPNHKLETLSSHYGITTTHHRAEADCDTCQQCFSRLKAKANAESISINKSTKDSYNEVKAKDIHATTDEFNDEHPFFGKTIAFTGTLEQMVRKDAMQLVVNLGGLVGDGVTAKTNYLVLGNLAYRTNIKGDKSSKLRKAESLIANGQDLQIIPEKVFYDIIGDAQQLSLCGEGDSKLSIMSKGRISSSVTIEDVESYLKAFDSVLLEFDQMIVDYLLGKIKLKKTLIEEAPEQPQEPKISILDLYKKGILNEEQFENLFSMEKERRYGYQRRKTIVDRIDSRTRTIREPLNDWHKFHRDKQYEKKLMEMVKEVSSSLN